jgi:ABC-type antimicrobial peptide transport system permease subunit
MLKNYLKITFRNLVRHKVFSLINIFGLAVGMACTVLILLWVQDELSYEKFFRDADKTYLVLRGEKEGLTAMSSNLLAPVLKEELHVITNASSYAPIPENIKILVKGGDKTFEESFSIADSSFFNVFPFKFLKGNPKTALNNPNSIVITKDMAEKYFGKEDAFGKSLVLTAFGAKCFMEVSGVLENIPLNTHIQRKIFLPINWLKTVGISNFGWGNQAYQTYIQVRNKPGNRFDIQKLSFQIKACELRHKNNQQQNLSYSLLPLTEIHLYGNRIKFLGATGDIKYVRIFIVIAIIILLIACINYMNLSTALSLKRTKEVGIKKTIGAGRKSLMLQFFGESLILSFIALGFAILLVEILLPGFNQLTSKELLINFSEPYFICGIFLLTIITGLMSGLYPAIFLSSFQPIQVLKGRSKVGPGSLFTRKGLVIFQFSLSIMIIISTIIVLSQLNFIRTSNLGFDKENLICINITGDVNSKYEVLKNELRRNPHILGISRSESLSSDGLSSTGDVFWTGKQPNEEKNFWVLNTDCDLASTLKLGMKRGRFYSDQFSTDKTSAFVINEAAAKSFGFKSPLNEKIYLRHRLGQIIGVVKDFHYASFHTEIEPLIFMIPDSSQQNGRLRILTIRYKSWEPDKIISFLENAWKEKLPGTPFNYYFYNDLLNTQYHSEIRMGIIFKYFSMLSILIACLGLLSLASVSAEQRTKEIGIRKVLGASASNVALILSKDFLILVALSNIIAWPAAYYLMNNWLKDFAYRINITLWVFLSSGLLALIIALLTVSIHAIKAATANPIESLKYE